jgi:putative sugar uptake protein lmo0169
VAFPLIIKYFGIQPAEFLLPQAIGYTVYCGAFFAIQGRGGVAPEDSLRHRRMFPSIFNGVLWGTAILLLQLNSNNLGAGTGFTLSQLGILISTPLGILWLHETRTRKELRWTIIGVALVIVGAVLAGVAKTLDVA